MIFKRWSVRERSSLCGAGSGVQRSNCNSTTKVADRRSAGETRKFLEFGKLEVVEVFSSIWEGKFARKGLE